MKCLPLLLALGLLSQVAHANCIGAVLMGKCHGKSIPSGAGSSGRGHNGSQQLRPDLYGPGVHGGSGGAPVTLQPDNGAVQGERLEVKPNAHGPGVHMDQYGRAVRERPWP